MKSGLAMPNTYTYISLCHAAWHIWRVEENKYNTSLHGLPALVLNGHCLAHTTAKVPTASSYRTIQATFHNVILLMQVLHQTWTEQVSRRVR